MPPFNSNKSLKDKLGIKPGFTAAFVNPPAGYLDLLGDLPPDVEILTISRGPCDFIQFFTRNRNELEEEFPRLKQVLKPGGMLWVSWPKKTSSIEHDLDETLVRETGLANGLVDVKICAIDQEWSALKFVHRRKFIQTGLS